MPPSKVERESGSWTEWRIAILREMEAMGKRMASVEEKLEELRMKEATRKGALAVITTVCGFLGGYLGSLIKLK